MKIDPVKLMLEVIRENAPSSKWVDAPLESYRLLGNTNRGDVGEIFVERYLMRHDVPVQRASSRIKEWDLKIFSKKFEVKTASEGKNGTFQFNHVRLDRKYDFLLCLGICPNKVIFDYWSKGEVAEGKSGSLVRMAEGQSITFKITKKTEELKPITNLSDDLVARLT